MMKKRRLIVLVLSISILAGTRLALTDTPAGPGLGKPAGEAEITQWDIGIMPDGEGLPPGKGTATEGQAIYEKSCVSCHGPQGLGDSADQLAGAKMGLAADPVCRTAGQHWRSMARERHSSVYRRYGLLQAD